MAWIESHQELRDHPKLQALAERLEISRVTAIGHLHCLWWWTLSYAKDGTLGRYSAKAIAAGAEWEGDPAVFVEALRAEGFIDPEPDRIHDWEDFAGKMMDRRQANAARQKASRDRVRLPIFERDQGLCRYCGGVLDPDDFVAEHMVPAARGGTDDPSNLVASCRSCNLRKNNRTPQEAGMPVLPIGGTKPPRSPRNAPRVELPNQHDLTEHDQPDHELLTSSSDHASAPPAPRQGGAARVAPVDRYPTDFEKFWSEFPDRPNNAKKATYQKWLGQTRSGVSAATLLRAVQNYKVYCDQSGKTGTETVMQGATFLGPGGRYQEFTAGVPQSRSPPSNGARRVIVDPIAEAKVKIAARHAAAADQPEQQQERRALNGV